MTFPPSISRKSRTTYGFSERKHVVELYLSGLGSKRISRETGIDDSLIRHWLRKYRAYGLESLQPYWREGREKKPSREDTRAEKERKYAAAYEMYATTLESVLSITRRHGLDSSAFRYHVKRFHPELVERRKQLKLKENNA